MSEEKKYELNYRELINFIPHRPPFILVDKVVKIDGTKSIHAIKAVSALEPFFPGHFPEGPIFPGVLMVEGMAQAGGILIFKNLTEQIKDLPKKCMLASIDKAKFRKPVFPGDVMHYHVEFVKRRGNFVWLKGTVEVDDQVIAEANFSAIFFNEE